MNTEIAETKTSLDVIFPDSRTITIARPGATEPETLAVYALPVQKWKQGFKYIAQIAPMLGFDLFAVASGEVSEEEAAEQPIDTQKIYDALMGEGGDLIIEFLAFATDKQVSFFDNMYDEIIDIMVAVIELNLNFFVQKLLPKVLEGTQMVVATARTVKAQVKQ